MTLAIFISGWLTAWSLSEIPWCRFPWNNTAHLETRNDLKRFSALVRLRQNLILLDIYLNVTFFFSRNSVKWYFDLSSHWCLLHWSLYIQKCINSQTSYNKRKYFTSRLLCHKQKVSSFISCAGIRNEGKLETFILYLKQGMLLHSCVITCGHNP